MNEIAMLKYVKGLLFVFAFSVYLIGCDTDEKKPEVLVHEAKSRNTPSTNWSEYNGDGARSHYSELGQVTKANVNKLEVAWTYSSVGEDSILQGTQMQCNPIIIDGILYGVSAKTQVFALDAATGKELWKTDIEDNCGTTRRGITYFSRGDDKRFFLAPENTCMRSMLKPVNLFCDLSILERLI